MTREMRTLVKRAKENTAILIRYANPKSPKSKKPTNEKVLEILYNHIPYCGNRPVITNFTVSSVLYH